MLRKFFKLNNAARALRMRAPPLGIAQHSVRNCAQTAANDEHDESKKAGSRPTNPFAREGTFQFEKPDTVSALTAEERTRRLKVLQLEADIAYQEGRRVPHLEFFKDEHWEQILTLPSKSARMKYYGYLWQVAAKKEANERKKKERAEYVLQHKEELRRDREENNHIIYGLGHTSLFLRVYDSTINHWLNSKLTRAMQFSPKLVLDCSYDKHMTRREALNAAKQLMLCFAENRAHDDPFDLHYCNVNLDSTCIQALKRYIPTMLNPEFPMNVHRDCFTELFPKERLVYLTPHCRHDLDTYDSDDVYIVGAMVDTVNNEPLSLAKAKRLGLRMARLPLDRYLQWGAGSGKSLTLNQMINIMLDLKHTGDWQRALTHVPRRKVINGYEDDTRRKQGLESRAQKLNVSLENIFTNDEKPKKMRTHMPDADFNIETWGKNKRKNKRSN